MFLDTNKSTYRKEFEMNRKEKTFKALRKISVHICGILCTVSLMTVNVFAADSGEFLSTGISTIQTVVTWVGAGVAALGAVNFFDGYSSNNPAERSQGFKQFIGGLGIILVANALIPMIGQ